MNESNVDNFLENWYHVKQQIIELEAKIDKYKKIATDYMDNSNNDLIKNDKYKLEKKDMIRSSVSKNSLPKDIWDTYSKENFYSAFYISKLNEKKKRSPIKKKLII